MTGGRSPMLSPSIGSVVDRGWMGLRAHGFLSARPNLYGSWKQARKCSWKIHIHTSVPLTTTTKFWNDPVACDSACFDHVGITWGLGRQDGWSPRRYLISQVHKRSADFSHQASRPAISAPPGSPTTKSCGRLCCHG